MTICPICGGEGTLKVGKSEYFATYGHQKETTELNYYTCSCCGEEFDADFEEKNEIAIKKASEIARSKSVAATLKFLEEENSFVEFERSLALPPKTLSKWKNLSKAPSAAAAALVSLLGVFPWLSYVGLANYEPEMAYKIAYAAVLKKATENPDNLVFHTSNELYDGIALIHQNYNNYNNFEKIETSTIPYSGENI